MTVRLLPKLNRDAGIPSFDVSGVWKNGIQASLYDLSLGLEVTESEDTEISSIPDVWARMILFKNSLIEPGTKMHAVSVAEWRGVLAILALRLQLDFKNIDIESMELHKDDFVQGSENGVSANRAEANRRFRELLRKSDYSGFHDSEAVRKIQFITIGLREKKKVLAIVTPDVLICPSIDLKNYDMENDVPWWDRNGIHDPSGQDGRGNDYLTQNHKKMLAKWVYDLIDRVEDNNISNLLNKYYEDLIENIDEAIPQNVVPDNDNEDLQIEGLCEILNKPIAGGMDADDNGSDYFEGSDVLLTSLNKDGVKRKLLVVTKTIDKDWTDSAGKKRNSANIRFAKHLSVHNIMPKLPRFPKDGKEIKSRNIYEKDNARAIMGEELFTEGITLIPVSYDSNDVKFSKMPTSLTKFVVKLDRQDYWMLLPLKTEILNYVSVEQLAKDVRISQKEEFVSVVLTLRFVNKATLRVEKVYNLNDEIPLKIYDDIPSISIWPNFRCYDSRSKEVNWWNLYYIHYSTLDEATFKVRPLYTGTDVLKNNDIDKRYLNEEDWIVRSQDFPNAFLCCGENGDDEQGLILLEQPKTEIVLQRDNVATFGIDFGTSNSVVCYTNSTDEKANTEMPKVCRFNSNIYKVTEIDKYKYASYLRNDFIPLEKQPTEKSDSIRTVLHIYDDNVRGNDSNEFNYGNIFYLESLDNLKNRKYISSLIVGKDMKWDRNVNNDYLRTFLSQTYIQCLAEAALMGAKSVNIVYSYPESFSRIQKDKLEREWKNIIDSHYFGQDANKGLGTGYGPENVRKYRMTESVAMSNFLIDENVNANDVSKERGFICLDIGGGSTDIAIWKDEGRSQSNKPMYQTSLMIAGNHILNDYIYRKYLKNKDVLGFLSEKCDNEEILETYNRLSENSGNRAGFDIDLEGLLKYHSNYVQRKLENIDAEDNQNGLIFLRDITFAMSGIMYYAGYVEGQVFKDKGLDISKDNKYFMLPACCIGGNASKILNWVGVHDNDFGILKECFISGLLGGYDPSVSIDERFDVIQSQYPKQEVASGLINKEGRRAWSNVNERVEISGSRPSRPSRNGQESISSQLPNEEFSIIAGEAFKLDGKTIDKKTLSVDDVIMGVELDEPEEFEYFVSVFNNKLIGTEFARNPIEFDKNELFNLRSSVNQKLKTLRADAIQDRNSISVEPLFIMMLKQAILELANR